MGAPLTLPRDARLPQLARAVDGDSMRHVFEAALREYGSQRVTACAVERIKYRPGRNCTVSYRLTVRDETRACSFEQRVAGRFCAAGEAAGRHARHHARVGLASRCGLPSLLVPSLELFAWFLPNDPKLDGLPGLLEVARNGGEALSQALAVMTGGDTDTVDLDAALVQYVPESRACARFDVALASGRRVRLFAKLDRESSGAATHRLMQALYDSPARREDRLRTPRPLLWQPDLRLHWQAAVPGVPLLDEHALCPPDLASEIGRLMSALHDTPAPLDRRVPTESLHGHVQHCASMLAQVDPDWAPALDRLARSLQQGAVAAASLPLATLHGDLHPRNLLLDVRRLSLIDLDGARLGPAALELGAWISDGLCRALHLGTPLEHVQEAAAHMLTSYAQRGRQPLDSRMLAWATARSLLCDRAFRGVANLKPGRLERVPTLIAVAELITAKGDVMTPLPC